MADKWYVCYFEPGKSLSLVEVLKGRGVEAECPSFTFRRRAPRRKKVELLRRPLIGGILFIGVGSWPVGDGIIAGIDLSRIRRMASAKGCPAVVEDKELDVLRIVSGETSLGRSSIYEGDVVEFCVGPFKGQKAIVVRSDSGAVLVEPLGGFPGKIEVAPFLLRKIQA